MNKFNPGDLVIWGRSGLADENVVGMVTKITRGLTGGMNVHVRWSDGYDEAYPPNALRPFNPCDTAAS